LGARILSWHLALAHHRHLALSLLGALILSWHLALAHLRHLALSLLGARILSWQRDPGAETQQKR
jgi:hypothetical protein